MTEKPNALGSIEPFDLRRRRAELVTTAGQSNSRKCPLHGSIPCIERRPF